jgi:putative ABC transport system permease protein
VEFIFEIIRLGLTNIRLHLLRSALTALGIILGVAAVITMVSIGEGKTRAALSQLERLGARNIIVRSVKPPEAAQGQGQQRGWVVSYGITRSDLKILEQQFTDAVNITPLKSVGAEVIHLETKQTSQAYGVTPELLDVARLRVARGRFITTPDVEDRVGVAVLGSQVAKDLYPTVDPLGKTLRIDHQVFDIVGVMAPVGLAGGAGSALVGRDLNNDVYLPITTARDRFNDLIVRRESGSSSQENVEISEIYYEAPTRDRVVMDAERLERFFEARHPGLRDIDIVVPYELLETAKREALQSNILLGAIAGISLLVGGIGIMNIMLATVTERTREIGVRRALGATRNHVVLQFLVETGVISTLGGLLGVVLGVILTFGIAAAAPYIAERMGIDAIHASLTGWSILLSFVVAVVTGIVFGIYPAIVAARQDPIVALRHD